MKACSSAARMHSLACGEVQPRGYTTWQLWRSTALPRHPSYKGFSIKAHPGLGARIRRKRFYALNNVCGNDNSHRSDVACVHRVREQWLPESELSFIIRDIAGFAIILQATGRSTTLFIHACM